MTDERPVSLGKGRPTPKRRDARGGRSGPVPPPPANRREAARRQKAKRAQDRSTGRPKPEREMLRRDQGPVRAAVRNLVDSRRGALTAVMVVLIAYVIATLVDAQGLARFILPLYLVALFAIVVEIIQLRLLVRRLLQGFPDDPGKGHVLYAVVRSTQFRRLRVPPPRVSPPPLPLLGRLRGR